MSSNGNGQIQKTNGGATMAIRELLEQRKGALTELLPRHLTADRLIKVALNCIAKTPQLQACSASTLLQSVIVAAELGLEPGGALGHLYLVPFGNVCTPIIGYRGFIELMRRSGQLAQIEAHIVHENDEFQFEFGLNPVMRHKPQLVGDAGKPVLVYVLARLKDGSVHCEVMTVAEVEKIRARARSGKSGPWSTDWGEMAKKTVLRRAAKYLPLSSEMARALEVEDEDYVDGEVNRGALPADTAIATEVAAPKSKANEKAKEAIRARQARPAVVDVLPGETEEQAESRVSQDPPPLSDADAPPPAVMSEATPF